MEVADHGLDGRHAAAEPRAGLGSSVRVEVRSFDDCAAARGPWRAVQQTGHMASSFQLYEWVSAWQEHIGSKQGVRAVPVVAGAPDGTPWVVLPLGIRRVGWTRVLCWLGGDISGYHGPLISEACPKHVLGDGFADFWRQVRRKLPAFDYVHFDRQPPRLGSIPNPFLQLGASISSDASPVTRLSGDWKEDYRRHASRKTRETERRKVRRMEDAGAVEFLVASDTGTADHIIDALVVQKKRWLGELGLADMFADGGCDSFLRVLFREHPELVHVSAITVGGEIWATHWALVHGGTFYYWFASYEQGDLTRYSPGDLLVRNLLEWSSTHGVHTFDFGIGDHPYKLRWADEQVPLHECMVPNSVLGLLTVGVQRFQRRLRTAIKRSPRLHAAALAVRARLFGRPQMVDGTGD